MTTFTIPTLETERLILRAPRESDFEAEAVFYQTEASRFVGGPKKPHETWRLLATMLGHWSMRGYGFWGVEGKETGEYFGRIGLWFPHGWYEREIGWTLMPSAQGKGFATEAALAARSHAYDTLNWSTAISQIAPANEASKAVAQRLGASFEKMYDDPEYGPTEVWRHQSAADLSQGGMEAYA